MGDFDEYEYLEKTGEEPQDGQNGDSRDVRGSSHKREAEKGYDGDEKEEDEEDEKSKRLKYHDDSRPRRDDRDRERISRDRDRERDRGRDRSYRERDRGREYHDRDRRRDRDDSDRRRDYGHPQRDRREKKEKEPEPEPDPERDQRTVFAYQINLKADERDVYEFFSRAGKVRDVRLIMDRNSRRSKGVGYIEFYDAMSVPMAIALSGQLLLGTPVMVKPSEAEKNLAAQNALPVVPAMAGMAGVPGGGFLLPNLAAGSKRLHVGNLHTNINEEQLKQVFEPFGTLELVSVPQEGGQSKGFGFVQYARIEDARMAHQNLQSLELAGMAIKITPVPEGYGLDMGPTVAAGELDDDEGGGLGLSAQSRAALMLKLDRTGLAAGALGAAPVLPSPTGLPSALGLLSGNPLLRPGLLPTGLPLLPGVAGLAGVAALPTEVIGTPSEYLLLKNMFDPNGEVDDEFEQDIQEDVQDECSKYGPVKAVHVERSSAGHVYVKFESVAGASAARVALHNRYFAGKPISATFLTAEEFKAKYGE